MVTATIHRICEGEIACEIAFSCEIAKSGKVLTSIFEQFFASIKKIFIWGRGLVTRL